MSVSRAAVVVLTRARTHPGRTTVTAMMDMYSRKTKDNAQVKYLFCTYLYKLFSVVKINYISKFRNVTNLTRKLVHLENMALVRRKNVIHHSTEAMN